MYDKVLKLRLQGLTTTEIGKKVGYSRSSIENWLKEIYDKTDIQTQKELLLVKDSILRKEKISIKDITPYQLGIIWGLGSYIETEMVFRSEHSYFLEHIQTLTDSEVSIQRSRHKVQYKLKSVMFDTEELKQIGWTERNAEIRDIPVLDNLNNYKDFLRAYIEIHSRLTYRIIKNKKGIKTHKKIRLKIYGNKILIQSINNFLFEFADVPKRNPYISKNNKTATITYIILEQIENVLRFVEGEPYYQKFWDDVQDKLDNPKIKF
jgi:hypothetical protein